MPAEPELPSRHVVIRPSVLYFGTPVVLLKEEGNANITPISSAWALGDRFGVGLGRDGSGTEKRMQPTGRGADESKIPATGR